MSARTPTVAAEPPKRPAKVIGIPREIKDGERRVALDPGAVSALVRVGARVLVEAGAGAGAGFSDADYRSGGAEIVPSADDAWSADLVVKVKEPLPGEWRFFRPDLTLFCYLHLAACPELAQALVEAGSTAFAFETVVHDGALPLLAPMSEIAGRIAPIVGAFYLSKGSGTLLGGAAGVPPARVVVIGLGVAGTMAARGARGLDAEVVGVDLDLARLRAARCDGTVTSTVVSSPAPVAEVLAAADLVIGAALVPGARAPVVVNTEHIRTLKPGSVVVDLAVDQGGCIATTRPTSLSDPVYECEGVLHYCVTNMPGQYPRTASRALSAALSPLAMAMFDDPDAAPLRGGLNVYDGRIVHAAVAAAVDGHRREI